MGKSYDGYIAGEILANILTLPILLFFNLIKYVGKIIIRYAKNHKKKNLKDM